MKLLIIKLKYRIFILWLSFKWIFRVNLGDKIYYRGQVCTVMNGVYSGSWSVKFFGNPYTGERVPQKECTKVWTISNMLHSFRSGYDFYMGYWYQIWVRQGIEDWMRVVV